ncbi:CRISPR-associated helicase Cas3' [candidate division KSB1 bacterium]|nr:CRISPR-associated helicase Cas3' [candidate division KSB1 bacterium]
MNACSLNGWQSRTNIRSRDIGKHPMEKISFSFELKSHPHLRLVDHLTGVAECAAALLRDKPVHWQHADERALFSTLVAIACFCHDLGKATTDFQQYIESMRRGEKQPKSQLAQHQRLSALLAYWAAEKSIENNQEYKLPEAEFYPLLTYLWVKKHHGNLRNLFDRNSADDELDPADEPLITKQLQHLIEPEFSHLLKTAGDRCGIVLDKMDFEANWQRINDGIFGQGKRLLRHLRRKQDSRLYFLFQYCYSLILTADKYHAMLGTLPEQAEPEILSLKTVQQFREEKFGSAADETSRLRNAVYQECVNSAQTAPLDNPFFALNVPTGSGKTLAALAAALVLAERISATSGKMPKIIYCLPFMSIIDQNHQVFAEVFDHPDSDILLKHHSLTEMVFKGHEYDADVASLLIEGWDARLVVTTFVQFFHTVIGNRNMTVRRMHQLTGSIIILDEIQTLPHRYWAVLEKLFDMMAQVLQCRFILMTATLPQLLPEENLIHLVPGKERYFQRFNRYQVAIDLEAQTITELAADIERLATEKSRSDMLIIVNTTRVARQLFREISRIQSGHSHYHLSTRLTPHDRIQRIDEIRNSDQPKIVISTQLVEAGVDLDFDIVIRDFAPLDSLNQAAGRCNRNGKKDGGDVRFIILCDDKGHPYYRYIYGKDDVLKMFSTRKIVESTDTINEQEFLNAIRNFYESIRESQSSQLADDIITAMEQLEFATLGTFKLIEEDYPATSVFIPQNEEAAGIWEQYTRLVQQESSFERRKSFLKLKPTLMQYVISIPINQLTDDCEQYGGIHYLPIEKYHEYYSHELGYVNENTASPAKLIF